MADVVAEALIGLGTVGVEAGMQAYRRWRDETYFGELTEPQQAAFLEVVLAAILQDGEQSEAELRWLERREAAGAARELIDAAMETVKRALPEGSTGDDYVAFVRSRVERLGEDESRERAFTNACRILIAANGDDAAATARLFGDGLGISSERIDETIGRCQLAQSQRS